MSAPITSFTSVVSPDPSSQYPAESGRYHLYIGHFCPFAHRVALVRALKNLQPHISISVVHWLKIEGRGGWKFLPEEGYKDDLYNSERLAEMYEKTSPVYVGKHSVPVLWDKKTEKIVNNESADLLRILGSAFDDLPGVNKGFTLYPPELQTKIDEVSGWMQSDLNTGVYKAGFATDQAAYEKNVVLVFKALNKLEGLLKSSGGPYILGEKMTEVDIRAYTTIVRFDVAYVEHFRVNLGTIRHNYPLLNGWLKNLYWNHKEFHESTVFKDIKLGYTKGMKANNPLGITPLGPVDDVEPLDWKVGGGVDVSGFEEGKVYYAGRTKWEE